MNARLVLGKREIYPTAPGQWSVVSGQWAASLVFVEVEGQQVRHVVA